MLSVDEKFYATDHGLRKLVLGGGLGSDIEQTWGEISFPKRGVYIKKSSLKRGDYIKKSSKKRGDYIKKSLRKRVFYVLQQFIAEFGTIPYYWAAKSPTAEVDFLMECEGNIIPLEVKAEKNLQAKSLKFYCKKYRPSTAVRISMGKYYRQTVTDANSNSDGYPLIDLPLYAVSQLLRECDK